MRNLLQAVLDELEKDKIVIAFLGEFEFLSGTVNLWSGPEGHVIDFDGKQWVALGEIGKIDKITEGQGACRLSYNCVIAYRQREYRRYRCRG